jgi:hypothetical protein
MGEERNAILDLIGMVDYYRKALFESHGCIYNSCSSCQFCWGYKGKTKEPELYKDACKDCVEYVKDKK